MKDAGVLVALALRHKPQALDITLDEHGWADAEQLVESIAKLRPFSMEQLIKVVAEDKKGRYCFSEDGSKIRANQGHSVNVDVELKKTAPPPVLYHGSAEKYVEGIRQKGLIPKTRLYVHLSSDIPTAVAVGSRHGKPVVYKVAAGEMAAAGYEFFLSVNGVWLTKSVPSEYLARVDITGDEV